MKYHPFGADLTVLDLLEKLRNALPQAAWRLRESVYAPDCLSGLFEDRFLVTIEPATAPGRFRLYGRVKGPNAASQQAELDDKVAMVASALRQSCSASIDQMAADLTRTMIRVTETGKAPDVDEP